MKVVARDRKWSLLFVKKPSQGVRGCCYHPRHKDRVMEIKQGLPSEETMEVVIHEMLHAERWGKSEAEVERTAREIARVLARLGFKRKPVRTKFEQALDREPRRDWERPIYA